MRLAWETSWPLGPTAGSTIPSTPQLRCPSATHSSRRCQFFSLLKLTRSTEFIGDALKPRSCSILFIWRRSCRVVPLIGGSALIVDMPVSGRELAVPPRVDVLSPVPTRDTGRWSGPLLVLPRPFLERDLRPCCFVLGRDLDLDLDLEDPPPMSHVLLSSPMSYLLESFSPSFCPLAAAAACVSGGVNSGRERREGVE